MRATISPDGVYRYDLERWWVDKPASWCAWVMLNPSTADHTRDDATVHRCVSYSQAWGFDGLVIVNLFALRSTSPAALRRHPDPVGPENDDHIFRHVTRDDVDRVVCAWGAHGWIRNRGLIIRRDLERACNALWTFGETKGGHPLHPGRLADTLELRQLEPQP